MLLGRGAECRVIERLLAGARAGRSGALVVRGEAGIGKTALLKHARGAASGFRVEQAVGVESEADLAFAGLHQLCAPMLDRLDALPEPQQTALGVAFGLRAGKAPDRFMVGLATLTLLSEAAEERPLLCLVDDVQWLDEASAQTLAFVARRVEAEPVALVFALREPGDPHPFNGLPDLRLDGLNKGDAQKLLATAVKAPLDERVGDRIIAEARGNPLALLELPSGAEPAELAGGFGLPDALSVPRRIEESFRRRSAGLPAETQLLLLVVAAESLGEAALAWRAAERLGIDREAIAATEVAGLVEIGARVRFHHPLVRSSVYRAAPPQDRRRVHRALAAATDPEADPDRRAWHRARATLGTDEAVAAELERSAGRARARGGLAAAAAFLEQAMILTPAPGDRARRALAAAFAKRGAGAPEAALELLKVAEAGPLDALQRARIELLRARIAFVSASGTFHAAQGSEAPAMLLDAARLLAPLDAVLARETYLEALEAALLAGLLGRGRGAPEVAEAVRAAPAPPHPPQAADLLLDGLTARYTRGYEAGVPTLRRALERLRDHAPHAADADRRWLWLGSRIAVSLWDDEMVYALASSHVRLAREAGALTELPIALHYLAAVLVHTGELSHAGELAAEADQILRATGEAARTTTELLLATWRGDHAEAVAQAAASIQDATRRRENARVTLAQYSLAVLHNGRGDHRAALAAAESLRDLDGLDNSNLVLPELIEAAVHAGEPGRAVAALELLGSRARAGGTQWGLGLEACSRALMSTGPDAEALYREAIERLGRCRMVPHLARAHLLYGEWLRRRRRRLDARRQLRTAHDLLSGMGMEAFAERAARELRATGEQPRKRTVQPADALTAQELHIARLVATGSTSKEVAAHLFLSPRTIDAHLRNIFRKLGITSRRQLRDMELP